MSRIKSKKYNGVYLNHLANKDVSYSITYKNEYNKLTRFTVGKKSECPADNFIDIKPRRFLLENTKMVLGKA